MQFNKVLELVGSILAPLGMYMIAFDHPVGWALSLIANVVLLIMYIRLSMGFMILMDIAFLAANSVGFYKHLIV